ncbi:hypothetical protein HDU67_005914 [Dinochytrium kinnereticum]|nr:hypothetical protein HDU67_005914 [Dinochytrium kinnereticum]
MHRQPPVVNRAGSESFPDEFKSRQQGSKDDEITGFRDVLEEEEAESIWENVLRHNHNVGGRKTSSDLDDDLWARVHPDTLEEFGKKPSRGSSEYGLPPYGEDSVNYRPFQLSDEPVLSDDSTPNPTPTPTASTTQPAHTERPKFNVGPLDDIESLAYPHPTVPATTMEWHKPDETIAPTQSLDQEPDSPVPTNIKNQYIISLKDSTPGSRIEKHMTAVKDLIKQYIASGKTVSPELLAFVGVDHQFDASVWAGYSGYFPPEIVAILKNSSVVEYIEPNRVIKAAGFRYKGSQSKLVLSKELEDQLSRIYPTKTQQLQYARFTHASANSNANRQEEIASSSADPSNTARSRAEGTSQPSVNNRTSEANVADQIDPPWNLDRIGHMKNVPVGLFRHFKDGGAGVDIYILDTGVKISHSEFGGRAIFGADFTGSGSDDMNGHGTHVAAVAAGKTYGVAKSANIIAVKVLGKDGTGSTTIVNAGLEWTIGRMQTRPGIRAVINLSLGGGGISKSLNDYVDRIVALGGVVAVAAGNANSDACANSPADSPNVLTVGALAQDDVKASFSNYGSCISLYAPGKEIQSAGIASNTAVSYESGTSQASPLAAGILAIYLSLYPAISVTEVYTNLLGSSYMNVTLGNMTLSDPQILLSSSVAAAVNIDAIPKTGSMMSLAWNLLRITFD